MNKLPAVRFQRFFQPILIAFLIIGGILFGLALWYTDTSATITITPQEETASATFNLRVADAEATGSDILPATVTVQALSATVTALPAAEGSLVDAHASGTMTVINSTDKAQPLTSGTRFRSTTGVIVRSASRVDVPAHGQATVRVVADPLGLSGEVPAGRFVIVALWTGLQDKIYGQTSAALTGGQTRQGASLDAASLTKASDEAQTQIRAELGESTSGTIRLLEPLSVATNPPADQASAEYQVTVKMNGRTIFYDPSYLERIVRQKLTAELRTGDAIWEIASPTVTVAENDPLTLKIVATASLTLATDNAVLQASAYTGKNVSELSALILANRRIKSVNITVVPRWQRTTPTKSARLRIILATPSP